MLKCSVPDCEHKDLVIRAGFSVCHCHYGSIPELWQSVLSPIYQQLTRGLVATMVQSFQNEIVPPDDQDIPPAFRDMEPT